MTIDFDAVIKDMNAGKETTFKVTKLSDPETLSHVEQWVSTRCMPLDLAMGGGFPVRRLTEIYGDNSTGKTLLATEAVIDTQEQDGLAVYADAEAALGEERMVELGCDPDKLLYSAVDTIDEVFKLLERGIEVKNKHFGKDRILTFVWDSVAAIVTKDELEEDSYEARQYPSAARAISGSLRKVIRKVAENNVCLIFVNQTRQKLGVMFGDGATTYGGNAIKFYSSVRLELENRAKLKAGNTDDKKGRIIGVNTQVTTVKNRLAPPYRRLTLPIYYQYGIDEASATFEFLKDYELFQQSGAWYTMQLNGKEEKFQRKNWGDLFDKHYDAIEQLIERSL